MTKEELEIQKLQLELAEAKLKIEDSERIINNQAAESVEWEMTLEARADKIAEEKLTAHRQQQQAIESDRAARSFPDIVTRPQSLMEYQSWPPSRKAQAISAYGEEMLDELFDKDRRQKAAAAKSAMTAKAVSGKAQFYDK